MSNENTRALRNCLAQFATGVTVITCLDANGKPVGVTANSFSSLSLEPALVLWSIVTKSSSRAAFESFGYFAVNILSERQQDLAMVFSKPSDDRFAQVDTTTGIQGLPLIEGSLAQFECKVTQEIEQGDHIIMIGEVLAFRQQGPQTIDNTDVQTGSKSKTRVETKAESAASRTPLLFSQGRFAHLVPAPLEKKAVNVGDDLAEQAPTAAFYEDYLPYLLARAADGSTGYFHSRLKHFGLTMLSWRVMACLSDGMAWTVNDLSRLSLAKQPTVSKLLDRLEAQRLIKRNTDSTDARKVMVTLTKLGVQKITPVIRDARTYNESLAQQFKDGELERLKGMLRNLIAERSSVL
jgi:4-hydroxyphenylacetate 3-hydroxylase, reductase component